MRQIMIKLVLLALILCGVLAGLNYEPGLNYDPEELRFACVVNQGFNYWRLVKEGAVQGGEDNGVYVNAATFDFLDVDEQIRLLERALYMNVDGVITMGNPANAELNSAIDKLVSAGIPVALIDTDSPNSKRNCYVGSDNYTIGQTAAEILERETGGSARVMVIVSRMDYANQRERYQGFADRISQYEDMEIVYLLEGESDKEVVQRRLRNALKQIEDLDAIFCAEGNSAMHIGTVLEEENMNSDTIKVLGMENSESAKEFLKRGIYTGCLCQDGFAMGYEAAEKLKDYCENPQKDKQIFYVDVFYIDQENVDETREK